jgi:mannose/fructose/N-acetylgalactosamine-specific phosphotransferase system component IIB
MISLVRVDDRLIHGQITVGWVPYLRASGIVVVNDRLAADPVLSTIVKAGGTVETGVDVLSVEGAVRHFKEELLEESRVIVLFESLEDARRALEKGLRFSSLNIGGIRGRGAGLKVGDAVVLSDSDQEVLRDLRQRGIAVEVRIVPGDRPRALPGGGGGS